MQNARNHNLIRAVCLLLSGVLLLLLLSGCNFEKQQVTMTVVQSPVRLEVGQSVTLVVTVDQGAPQWFSADENIATVEKGVVTGVSDGETQIIVICGNLTTVCQVVVTEAQSNDSPTDIPTTDEKPSSIVLMLSPLVLEVGQTAVLSARSSTTENLVWYSTNSGVASVDDGVVSALSVGETLISVSAGEASATCNVQVVEATSGTDDGEIEGEYVLVWFDEFDGTELDSSKWSYQMGIQDFYGQSVGPAYWGNNELQYYTDSEENVGVSNGCLYITAKKQTMGNRNYTSARIVTRGKFSQTYGRFEAKIKLPAQSGMWPAFWLLPEPTNDTSTENAYGHWPTSGEIDIMEARGRLPYEVGTALHYVSTDTNGHKFSNAVANLIYPISDWHTYAVEWTPDYIIWFVDGQQVMKLLTSVWYNSNLPSSSGSAPFDMPFYLLFNLAVGGNYDGGIAPDDDFVEGTMFVDYVKVWRKI